MLRPRGRGSRSSPRGFSISVEKSFMAVLTILGLGPGDANLLTREAWDLLQATSVLYLRTAIHPTVAALPRHLELRAFDTLYESASAFGEVYDRIATEL